MRGISMQHRLSEIDEHGQTGYCRACEERVQVQRRRSRGYWECRNVVRARKRKFDSSANGRAATIRRRPAYEVRERERWAAYSARPEVKEARAATRRVARLSGYGLTPGDVDAMREAQEDRCAICRRREPLVIDHDHATGCVRGLLCNGCNRGLGFFREDSAAMHTAIDYLTRPRVTAPARASAEQR